MSTAELPYAAEGGFFVVGIGASAGGVEALEHLFSAMPPELGAAVVVVTHLGAHRETRLAEIIGRCTEMPVANASHGERMRPGCVYVLPSDHVLTLDGANLHLQRLAPGQRERNPIDVFFTSIANQWRENAVGIVLSGAGSDGTLGVKAIKEEGGLTIAQGQGGTGPAHDSMPLSVVASGLVDLVLPVEQIGAKLQQSMARKGLRLELRTALREAAEKRCTIVRERVEVDMEDRVQLIRLTVQPIIDGDQEPLYLIVFADLGRPLTCEEAALHDSSAPANDVEGLEHELKETRDRLQATIEEYETALQELKSGNEELQSTNEELETSKEELQSVNEELHTVNNELASNVDDLYRSNADLRNLFESTQIATIFLDRHLIIRSYTPAVTAIFNLIASDRGRPITDIAHQLDDVDLARDIRRVLDERTPLERPVRLRGGKVFHLMRILPYRTADEQIDGVLVTFVNVTEVVVAEEQQRLLVAELNHRVRNMLQVVIGLANQTLHRSEDLQEFEKAFMGRMQSLARAYELVSREGWHKVLISELLRSQLTPFVAEGSRYSAEGDRVLLSANAALALGLVLYELATNATKYGALSVPGGTITVSWRLESRDGAEPSLIFRWQERGGPKVTEPSRRGFGSELMQRQLRYELNGSAAMEFSEEGLQVTLEIPSGAVMAAPERSSAERARK